MPGPGMPGPPGPPGKESGTGSKSNATDNAAIARQRRGQWSVGTEPAEREILTNAAGEKFPARYEQALSGYYRALATDAKP
jgi:hypothetical protein